MSSSGEHPIGRRGYEKGLIELADRLGYSKGPSDNLKTAFTHPSFANETIPKVAHNERLEFLGDAVLDLVIAEALMIKFPGVSEGELHRLRTTLVRTETLAAFSRNLRLGQLLRLGKGEVRSKGRKKDSLLANAFEAMVGAIYLDRGFVFTKDMVLELMRDALSATVIGAGVLSDPKSKLQEVCQQAIGKPPTYKLVDSHGPEHDKEFVIEVYVGNEVRGRGVGRSKKLAERKAAEQAIESWSLPE